MASVVYDFAILGGGISALSLAEDIHVPTVILEAESDLGGLCRSFDFRGVPIDVGPHIIFSKYDEVLKRHTERISTNRIRRMNRILLNGKFIKYPFENDLASCRPEDRDEALQGFLNNPY
jgi:protoporphyrinogen oxidase